MNFKVELERQFTIDESYAVNMVLKINSADLKTLEDFYGNMVRMFKFYESVKFGRGASHIWVSNLKNERILKIIKNQ